MKKATAENIKGSLPSLVKVLSEYLKSLFSLEGKKELIDNASGSLGFLIQLLGKPAIDKHFERVKEKKLEDFGFDTYIAAAFAQSVSSVQHLKDAMTEDLPLQERLIGVQKDFNVRLGELERKFTISVFQPRYHPAVQMIREIVVNALAGMELEQKQVNDFKKHFNDNIESSVAVAFGDEYEPHKKKVEKFLLQENETRLLLDTISNSKIGFAENEDLRYEDAYGSWTPITERSRNNEENERVEDVDVKESNLKKVEDLIEEYFSNEPDNHLQKMLFLVADFGKGKSVFLKNYAARIAKDYLESGDGFFPVYFNLRSFSSYGNDSPLGIVDEYLQTVYGIKINADYFKQKRFVFLLDSLDESCDLSKIEVEKVLSSMKRIQNIDKATVRSNRIIVSSRPFDEALFWHIQDNRPHEITLNKLPVTHFLTLYGFTKKQFNSWINHALKEYAASVNVSAGAGFAGQILNELKNVAVADVYSILSKPGSLGPSELRRPIFAYMIYQLILNNVGITSVGKVGIYLSFLNLLTKEAKYLNDPNHVSRLQDQFAARNILHQIAALWIYEKGRGKQAVLNKADICRMIGGFSTIESDAEVLEEYRKKGFDDIQFLSHSYFGENDNKLHFQHQSFAEILLAEYYMKVFICCALDRSVSLSFVVSMLKVGYPTEQCLHFFGRLLRLLRETVSNVPSAEVLEKRKLLTPLMASIALSDNNRKLNSQSLFYKWYEPAGVTADTREIPAALIYNWCVDQQVLDRIVELCSLIISSEETYVHSKSTGLSPLIKNEVTLLHNKFFKTGLILEKELALIAGNMLFNGQEGYFIRTLNSKEVLSFLKNGDQSFLKMEFVGVNIIRKKEEEDQRATTAILSGLTLTSIYFKEASFDGITFVNCHFIFCLFDEARFHNVSFRNCRFVGNDFLNCKFSGDINLNDSLFDSYGLFPPQLAFIGRNRMVQKNLGTYFLRGPRLDLSIKFLDSSDVHDYFREVGFYFQYLLQNDLVTREEALSVFNFGDPEIERVTISWIDELSKTPDH